MTSEYKRISARECALRLLKVKRPVVLIHRRPDGDAVGSGAALCEVFSQLGEDCALLSADKIPRRLEFILEHTKTKVANSKEGRCPVTIDVASPSQLGSLLDTAAMPTLMIDHHAVGESFADGYIVPDASSAAEALLDVIEVLIDMGRVRMNETLAYALYAAISSDTGCFAYSNTSPKTHRRAAELIEHGIDSSDINHRLFYSKSPHQIKAEGFVASAIKTALDGKVAYAEIKFSDVTELGLLQEHFESAIDVVRSLDGAEIAFVVKETCENEYKISLRSTGANVAKIASVFGGGGHIRAAGCSVNADSIKSVSDSVINEIKNNL